MAKLILCAVVVTLICACVAQDFEPNPLEDPTTTTTEAPPTTTTTTEKPNPQTTEKVDPSTDSPFPEKTTTTTAKPPKDETTVKPSTTTAKIPENPWKPVYPVDTTTTTDKTIEATTQASVKPTTTAKPSYYPWRPWYPGFPGHLENGNNHCYYKKQVGYPQMRWACGRLQYYTPIECYLCCQYPYSMFAGCNKVDNYHCQNGGNHIGYNYKK